MKQNVSIRIWSSYSHDASKKRLMQELVLKASVWRRWAFGITLSAFVLAFIWAFCTRLSTGPLLSMFAAEALWLFLFEKMKSNAFESVSAFTEKNDYRSIRYSLFCQSIEKYGIARCELEKYLRFLDAEIELKGAGAGNSSHVSVFAVPLLAGLAVGIVSYGDDIRFLLLAFLYIFGLTLIIHPFASLIKTERQKMLEIKTFIVFYIEGLDKILK